MKPLFQKPFPNLPICCMLSRKSIVKSRFLEKAKKLEFG